MFDKTKQFVRDRWGIFLAAWVGVSVWARVAVAAVGLSAVISGGLYAASGSAAGFMSSAHFTKLSALQTANNSWGNFKITSLGSGTDAADAINYNELLNPFKVTGFSDDFLFGATSSTNAGQQFFAGVSGTGAAVAGVSTGVDSTHIGVWQQTTGTTATGRAAILTTAQVGGMIFGTAGQAEWEWLVQVPTLSTTGVQQYTYEVGLADTITGGVANGIYYRYDAATSTAWQFCTAAASSRTCTATSTTVTAGAWVRLSARKAEGSANWTGYINDVSTGITNSTNLPSLASQPISALVSSVGTTAKTVLADIFRYRQHFTTERGI